MNLNTFLKYSLSSHTFINIASIYLASYSTVHFISMKITDKLEMCRPDTHYFVHQRAATDNGIIHLSYVKASAALDFFDNIYPFLVSEEHPLFYNTMVLSEPVRAILPQIIQISFAVSPEGGDLSYVRKKYILNICVKFKFLSTGGNAVMCNRAGRCVYVHAQTTCIPLWHTFSHVASFCFKRYLTPFPTTYN